MKQFLIKIIILVVFPVIVMDMAMVLPKDNWSLHSHEQNIVLAHDKLAAIKDSQKVVIIAGSNGGFSLNSRLISQDFHIPVVNTATHAGLGVRLQFELYKEFLKKGDIVIFCPEYNNMNDKTRILGNATVIRIVRTLMPSAISKMSIPQLLFLHKYIGKSFLWALDHRDIKEFSGPYSVHSLNEYGDIAYERGHKDSIELYDLKGSVDDVVVKYYKYIHTYARERGIRLLFLPPTFCKSNFTKNAAQIDSIATTLRNNGIPYQASPVRYTFPDSLYFDTPYHMTPSGADRRTEKVIEDLHHILR